MSNKQDINKLIIKLQSMERELESFRKDLTIITSKLPDKDIEDDVELFVKLKYDDIKYNNPETWEKIKDLPHSILEKWEQRLWLERRNIFGYGSSHEEKLKKELGEKGYKSIDHWLWYIPNYIKSIMCNPSSISECLNQIQTQYSKGTLSSKEYISKYFDMLKEEILAYENKKNKE